VTTAVGYPTLARAWTYGWWYSPPWMPPGDDFDAYDLHSVSAWV
jgi:hypothetical protein